MALTRHAARSMTANLRIPARLIAWSAAFLLAGCAYGQQAAPAIDADLVIRDVAVVDVERGQVLRDRHVVIRGDRIAAVLSGRRADFGDAPVIDGGGKYLIPGLWDMHAHLGMSGDPLGLELPLFTAHGVTGVRVMGSPRNQAGLARIRQVQTATANGTVVGPRVLAVASWAVNGEAGIPDSSPPFFKARTFDEGRALARHFKDNGYDLIKVYNNVSREGYLGLAEEARRLGMPFAGHEPASVSALEMSDAGQGSIEHSRIFLFNCFPGADSMRRGLLRVSGTALRQRMVDEYDARTCGEVFRRFARNRTYITPTHVTRRMDAFADDPAYRGDPRLRFIGGRQRMAWFLDANGMVASDPSLAGRRSFMEFYRKGLALTHEAHRAGVPVILGTDAGDTFVFPGSAVHDELGELVTAGLSPAEALRAATRVPAEFLGREAEFGAVAPGRYADLVVLDADPLTDIGNVRRILAVIQGGRVLLRPALDSMLASVERRAMPGPQARLWLAAVAGDTAGIAAALADGASVDSLDGQGNRRAMNYAALGNHVAVLRLLLARGASIDEANRTGFTPLHHAAEVGSNAALALLLEAGADRTRRTAQGLLAIDLARRRGDEVAVRLLEAPPPGP